LTRIAFADSRLHTGLLLGIRQAREDAQWKVDQLAILPTSAVQAGGMDRTRFLLELQRLYSKISEKNQQLLNGSRKGAEQ
jgi:hypothetical protein